MAIYIQDPIFSKSYSLHEALISASQGASYAAGSYAFVSRDGVDLLMGDPSFVELVSTSAFSLIVGMDSITNESAIQRLLDYQKKYDKLNLKAFIHDNAGSLYHPKICWFKTENGGVVVTGSGNLTVGGLRKNREAFSCNEVSEEDISEIEVYWNTWLQENEKYLFLLSDDVVAQRAKLNKWKSSAVVKIEADVGGLIAAEDVQEEDDLGVKEELGEWCYSDSAEVLIAEIPKSKSRWKQANFDVKTFEEFFGGSRHDSSRRIVMRVVLADGDLGEIENRPCVPVASDNYRVELAAAAGLPYPPEGRPVGIFVKISVRMFLYCLSMPGDGVHEELQNFLSGVKLVRAGGMRRTRVSVGDIRELFKTLPVSAYLHD